MDELAVAHVDANVVAHVAVGRVGIEEYQIAFSELIVAQLLILAVVALLVSGAQQRVSVLLEDVIGQAGAVEVGRRLWR